MERMQSESVTKSWKAGMAALAAMFAMICYGAAAEEFEIAGDHGMLSAVFEKPTGDATNHPAVMVMHGYSGNKDAHLLREISRQLNNAGFATLRFDFNGHGKSEGRFQDMTVPNEVEDAKKVWEYLRSRGDVTEISLVGHSQGGVVASLLAGELGAEKIRSVALLAPAAVLKDDAKRGNAFGRHYDSANPPEFVEIFGRRLGRAYILAAQKLQIYETVAKFNGPLLVIHGKADKIVPCSYATKYKDVLPDAKIEILEGVDHGFSHAERDVAALVARFFSESSKRN